ncbi:MAG: SxtJ family membrane protein [Gammaproteobacteria bacterium]|nr:SxtJ family membrane protein [Gammaproteobacteria bacterium]
MSDTHTIPELDRKGLREFGLVTGGIVAVLFGLFFPWLLDRPIPRWPWIIFGVLAVMGLAAPMALKPVYKTWMKFGLLMSKVMTPLIMGIAFFLTVTPLALVMRLLGKDYMARKLDRSAASYRVPSTATPPKRLEKPF